MKTFDFTPSETPPAKLTGVGGWLRKNLFAGPVNTVVTLGLLWLVVTWAEQVLLWAVLDADFIGSTRDACTREGACWVFIQARFEQFMFGFYPESEIWRPVVFFAATAGLILWLLVDRIPYKKWALLITLIPFPVLSAMLLHGGTFGLETVETHQWGGLMVTLIIALTGILASLPFGVLLALGRRSDMPVIRSISTVYIEFWRGVPLITVLFMASVMLPLFLSGGTEIDKLLRALIGVVLFNSAYMAEAIRGGLQSISKGQYEAAEALGLGYWKMMRLVILPQALKVSIPSIVNTFIALLKDTSLVLIIGMFDVLGIAQSANSDPAWLGFSTESYLFAAFIFWVMCFGMSRYSLYLENKLHTGH
ncbi:amino acid ABC transporter permease [Photobacterium sp. CAU 1568]|uniref:Amino acid ABC transporter permease n=1 Tax=Photobacterium arenosum TaxID=2774143 RepID=A0ABR9BP34_9GAMM|nr:amino acid ABC transporter permease [Photobacterium arenosum]MBD8513994.1 amino acid ABC transporter permease [Photobacterium arenosum]